MKRQKIIHAVILAGGKGTRFWPLSRENCPKQMLNIVGEDTLLRQAIKRLHGFISLDNVWIITTDSLAHDIRLHLKPLGDDADKVSPYKKIVMLDNNMTALKYYAEVLTCD